MPNNPAMKLFPARFDKKRPTRKHTINVKYHGKNKVSTKLKTIITKTFIRNMVCYFGFDILIFVLTAFTASSLLS